MAAGTSVASPNPASSTSQTPSPAPVNVTSRADRVRARISPLAAHEGGQLGGQVVRQRRMAEGAQRREVIRQPGHIELEDPFRAAQVLQLMVAEVPQRQARRQRVADQRRGGVGEQDLTAVADGGDPGGAVYIQAHQPGADPGRLTGVYPHPDPHVLPVRPLVGLQGPLQAGGGRHRRVPGIPSRRSRIVEPSMSVNKKVNVPRGSA